MSDANFTDDFEELDAVDEAALALRIAARRAQRFLDAVVVPLAQVGGGTARADTKARHLRQCEENIENVDEMVQRFPAVDLPQLPEPRARISALRIEAEMLTNSHVEALVADAAVMEMLLAAQCAVLGIPLEVMELPKTAEGWLLNEAVHKGAQQAALAHLRVRGYEGVAAAAT